MRNEIDLAKYTAFFARPHWNGIPRNPREASYFESCHLDKIVGSVHVCNEDVLLLLPECSYDDYTGFPFNISNYRQWENPETSPIPHENKEGETQVLFYGGPFDKHGVLINLNVLSEADWKTVLEVLEKLENYIILDEDHTSEVEVEIEEAAWYYLAYDFRHEIEKFLPNTSTISVHDSDDGYCTLHQLLLDLMYDKSMYFEIEPGCIVTINLSELLENETAETLMRFDNFMKLKEK